MKTRLFKFNPKYALTRKLSLKWLPAIKFPLMPEKYISDTKWYTYLQRLHISWKKWYIYIHTYIYIHYRQCNYCENKAIAQYSDLTVHVCTIMFCASWASGFQYKHAEFVVMMICHISNYNVSILKIVSKLFHIYFRHLIRNNAYVITFLKNGCIA